MKKKTSYIILTLLFIFIFVLLFRGMHNTNTYKPSEIKNKNLFEFSSKDLFLNKKVNIKELLVKKNFTLINIWSSWCVPCKLEHEKLMNLSNLDNLTIIGLNYKDKPINAKKFINDLGNPYSKILLDPDGTISIQLGAYGVPETFLINKDSKILKKYIGELTIEQTLEIEKIIN
tara:strand:- start:320 stop:841 length:522 start_codon:yes stop_codon:yes gene_type:complete